MSLISDDFSKTRLSSSINSLCSMKDIDLYSLSSGSIENIQNNYESCLKYNPFKNYNNIIIYGQLERTSSYLDNRNVLYLEEDLLRDPDFYYIDNDGWNGDSGLVKFAKNKEEPDISSRDEVLSYIENIQNIEMFSGPKEGGHILVCLQSLEEQDMRLLELVNEHLGKQEIRIVYFPEKRKNPNTRTREYINKKSWEIQESASYLESLSQARAVVTNFGDIAIDAMIRGIPCATCMNGCYTNSHSTFECKNNSKMLKYLLEYQFDREAAERMLISIYKSRIAKNTPIDDILENVNIASWIVSLRR